MTRFPQRWARLVAALSFGAAGVLLPVLWFGPTLLRNRDGVGGVLYIVLPGLAAATAGALAGHPLLSATRTRGTWQAVGRGALVASLALLIFAPLFALLFRWTAPERTDGLGLTAFVLVFSAVAVWPTAAATGGAVGWLLYRVARALRAAEPPDLRMKRIDIDKGSAV